MTNVQSPKAKVQSRGPQPPPRPSPLSVLQRLPRERQEELFRFSDTHSHKDTAQWLAEAGVKASGASIGRFRRWFHRRRRHEDNAALTKDRMELRCKEEPNISEEELAVFGRKVFARLAIDMEDGPEWVRQQLVRQREIRLELEQGRLRLARERFEFDAAKACLRHFEVIRVVVKNTGLSEPEKVELIVQALFGKAVEISNGTKGTNGQNLTTAP